jgi:CRP-like cAMP-binding protein
MLATAYASPPTSWTPSNSHAVAPSGVTSAVTSPAPCGPAPRATPRPGLASTLSGGAIRILEAKEHAFCEGDAATHVYRVEAGHVCIYRMLADGRRQVIDFAYPGDMIGLGAMREHTASAQATERTKLQCFSMAALHEISRHDAELSLKLYEAVAQELAGARDLLMTVTQRTARERLAGFLLALSRRNRRRGSNGAEIVLPMTRSDIADFLGLTIETVSRTFTKFRLEGLIDLEQCILVTIPDLERLEQTVCGVTRTHRGQSASG